MAAPTLYERYLAKLRSEENWADRPVEMFLRYARDELTEEGHRINDADPLHALAVYARAREIRDCVAEFCTYVDLAHAAKIKAKGGRPSKSFPEIVILAAAYYRCKKFGPAKSRPELCREAAKALGGRISAKIVSDALERLPQIVIGIQSQCSKNAPPDEGARIIADILRAVGEGLRNTNRELKAEAKQAEVNRKSARFAPVLVCSNSAR